MLQLTIKTPLYYQKPGPRKISMDRYHSYKGISSSALKLLEESPEHFENKNLFEDWDKHHFRLGRLVHSLVLEPRMVNKIYSISPVFNLRTNQGKADKEAFEKENEGKTVLTESDLDEAKKMARNVKTIAGKLFENGKPELSFFSNDGDLFCKCRPDYFIENPGICVDIKTISVCNDFEIQKALTNFKYHWQAYWYIRTLALCGFKTKKFIFVFVGKDGKHMVKIRELSNQTLSIAEDEVETLIEQYREYKQTGKSNILKTADIFGV